MFDYEGRRDYQESLPPVERALFYRGAGLLGLFFILIVEGITLGVSQIIHFGPLPVASIEADVVGILAAFLLIAAIVLYVYQNQAIKHEKTYRSDRIENEVVSREDAISEVASVMRARLYNAALLLAIVTPLTLFRSQFLPPGSLTGEYTNLLYTLIFSVVAVAVSVYVGKALYDWWHDKKAAAKKPDSHGNSSKLDVHGNSSGRFKDRSTSYLPTSNGPVIPAVEDKKLSSGGRQPGWVRRPSQ